MRIINRYGHNKAGVYHLTVWRRAAVAFICFLIAGEFRGDFAIAFLFGFAGMVATALALRAIYIKARVSIWP